MKYREEIEPTLLTRRHGGSLNVGTQRAPWELGSESI